MNPDPEMNPQTLLAAWFETGAGSVAPTSTGTNNRSFLVTVDSCKYILRLASDMHAEERVTHELVLLRELRATNLPFRIPAAQLTLSGECLHRSPGPPATVATVFSVIPGKPPERGNIDHAAVCGEALGELDTGMGTILPDIAADLQLWVDPILLEEFVSDPVIDEARLFPLQTMIENISGILTELAISARAMIDRFPLQTIHCDFFPANVLVDAGKVSGILDFEFVARGPRVQDLAIGLWTFGSSADSSFNWSVVEAFAAGYATRHRLDRDELAAIPEFILLREAISLVHWADRYRQGMITWDNLVDRLEQLVRVHTLVASSAGELVQRVTRAVSGRRRSIQWNEDRVET